MPHSLRRSRPDPGEQRREGEALQSTEFVVPQRELVGGVRAGVLRRAKPGSVLFPVRTSVIRPPLRIAGRRIRRVGVVEARD